MRRLFLVGTDLAKRQDDVAEKFLRLVLLQEPQSPFVCGPALLISEMWEEIAYVSSVVSHHWPAPDCCCGSYCLLRSLLRNSLVGGQVNLRVITEKVGV